MKILVLNTGSSTLKFDLFRVDLDGDGELATSRLAHGLVDRIGDENPIIQLSISSVARGIAHLEEYGEEPGEQDAANVRNHRDAVAALFSVLGTVSDDERVGVGEGGTLLAGIDAVGHRIVSGGDRFRTPVLIDDAVLAALEGISELAPLHNPAALLGVRAAREVLGASIPMVAVFDTAFHTTLPDYAYTYALPRDLEQRHGIRRYGFHGIAHEYMLMRYAALSGTPKSEATIITLQLGNGCSATAIRDGKSVDTSMGFTPLEGLVMGTRSGDIDPSIVSYISEKEQVDAAEVERWLNRRSGLLGVSGRSSDMRDLLHAEAEDQRAALAIELFCYRARKYFGAYLAVLGGAQAVVFGGGIGEHAPSVRARICAGMEWCGLRLDPDRNASMESGEGRISPDNAQIAAYVVPVDESILIARYTVECVSQFTKESGRAP